jgi:prophage maintenance system killer protein
MTLSYKSFVEDVHEIQKQIVISMGGLPGVRSDTLESLVLGAGYQEDQTPEGQAAYWLAHLAKGHYFIDANKRTAWFTARLILLRHGMDLSNPSTQDTAGTMVAIATAPSMADSHKMAEDYVHRMTVPDSTIKDIETFNAIVIGSYNS